MATPPSPIAERARTLLQKKDEQVLPDGKKLHDAAAQHDESTSDAFLAVLVEGAYLVAASDGSVSPEESKTLAETIAYVIGDDIPASEFSAMIESFGQALSADGFNKRIAAMADAVRDAPARRESLAFAALIALCDHRLVEPERQALTRLGGAFGFDEAAVQAVIDQVASSLSG